MCRISWSAGIGIARAVSITRSTSMVVTSLSLMATMPFELKLRMWLPAMPVVTILDLAVGHQLDFLEHARIVATVSSMLTTTPSSGRASPASPCR